MKLNSLSVLCLLLLVFHIPFSLTRGSRSSGSRGSSGSSAKTTHSHKHEKSNTNHKKGQSNPQNTAPKQSSNNQRGARVSYPQAGVVVHGRYGTPGGYPGGYVNQNPNNKVLSPHYAGSFGYGGYHPLGGSLFSRRISEIGLRPNDRSKGFGHRAATAAAQVTITRMALGYGLGSFPRPHFHFQDSQQECHYNQYMYKKYGTRSNDGNDYSRDYVYRPPPQTYDSYMKSCMTRSDLLPAKSKKTQDKPAKTIVTEAVSSVSESETVRNTTKGDGINSTATVNTETPKASTLPPLNAVSSVSESETVRNTTKGDGINSTATVNTETPKASTLPPLNAVSSVSESETVRNTTKGDGINSTATVNTENPKASTLPPLNQSEAEPVGPASLVASSVEDDDTVSIVEIGYPALIEQMKARRCLELYLDYSERNGRVQGLKIEFQGLLAAVIGTILMLHNSNMLPN